ncbi:MAG: ATP-binding cassette domain-containing protein [Chloroflexi bacterium]|nr:ATP-binding cassette domain-containing protein [Chloroflexota bacterium]
MPEAIRAEALIRQFGIIRAVNEVSFVVEPGEVFGMLGPNGAGKTTLVRLLNGVIEPDSGAARVLGFDPRTQGEDVRRQTGVLTETPALAAGHPAGHRPGRRRGVPECRNRAGRRAGDVADRCRAAGAQPADFLAGDAAGAGLSARSVSRRIRQAISVGVINSVQAIRLTASVRLMLALISTPALVFCGLGPITTG